MACSAKPPSSLHKATFRHRNIEPAANQWEAFSDERNGEGKPAVAGCWRALDLKHATALFPAAPSNLRSR